jgi:16S rRNA (guanine966-N2)-methyltransferase
VIRAKNYAASITDVKKSESETVTLRIIAGDLRSRKIQFACDRRTRPMKDRTREAVMNLLGGTLEQCVAFDLFGGSGVLAFESISRGAEKAVVWEILRNGALVIQNIARELGVQDRVQVLHEDVFRWSSDLHDSLKRLHLPEAAILPAAVFAEKPAAPELATSAEPATPFEAAANSSDRSVGGATPTKSTSDGERSWRWAVFCCPPYAMWETQGQELQALVERWYQHAPSGSLFAVELELPTPIEYLPVGPDWDIRTYSPAKIAIAEKP